LLVPFAGVSLIASFKEVPSDRFFKEAPIDRFSGPPCLSLPLSLPALPTVL
jgi:hypothetical protein